MPEMAADRVRKELQDLDKLILALPSILVSSKFATLKRQAEVMESLSLVLMLTILLDRPCSEVLAASDRKLPCQGVISVLMRPVGLAVTG